MGLNDTPQGERIHIGIFGKRNAGKSSLMNALTGQSMSIVSSTPGTTTDPVKKAMELLPLGPVLLIDSPGIDDTGELGKLRVNKTFEALRHCNIAILVIDRYDNDDIKLFDFVKELKKDKIPYIICINKCEELSDNDRRDLMDSAEKMYDSAEKVLCISTSCGLGINELKAKLPQLIPSDNSKRIIGDRISIGDIIVLVVPIDSAAPKGRLILPQQQTIRDILESGGIPVVTRESELAATLSKLSEKPRLVITDSQAFAYVSKIVPEDILLTSFSILMSNYKGDLDWQMQGVKAIERLNDEDLILISEGCTHHRQCGDIGTVKLPSLLEKYTGKKLNYHFTSGGEFPEDLSSYKMIIHCGACTLNEREMRHRIDSACVQNIPITNYGIAISYMNGILNRSTKIFTL